MPAIDYNYDSYLARTHCINSDRFEHPGASPVEVQTTRDAHLVRREMVGEVAKTVLRCSACKKDWAFTPSVSEGEYRASGDCTKVNYAIKGIVDNS